MPDEHQQISRPVSGLPRVRYEVVVQLIEQDVQLGRLIPGSWLKQIDLERNYNASRIEVRQALDWLTHKGLVEQITNRGYRVRSVSQEDLAQLLTIRAILETGAVELATPHLKARDLARLGALAQAFKDAVQKGTSADQQAANTAFHMATIVPCGNRQLVDMILDLRYRERLGLIERRRTVELLQRDAEDHFALVECIRAKDLAEVKRVLRNHILGGAD